MLVGTTSVVQSAHLADMLSHLGLSFQVIMKKALL
ncbi:hypothetical protein [Schinkia azotoformans]